MKVYPFNITEQLLCQSSTFKKIIQYFPNLLAYYYSVICRTSQNDQTYYRNRPF